MKGGDVLPILTGESVLVLGGDGFCGWPTALRFSALGAHVTIVDNGSRRALDTTLGIQSLTEIRSLPERIAAWKTISGRKITSRRLDIAKDYGALVELLTDLKPTTIIHFAEQRSAPYSMLSSEGARYSVDNNIRTTHNLLAAMVEAECDAHLMHLGTIGIYGYGSAGMQLPEGYAQVTLHGSDGREVEREILYPGEPVSIYHMTKQLDQHLCAFYARHYGLRITDLHQGIVWGTQTEETRQDPRLVNRFDHDAVYGTVVNRFLVQAFEGKPLTVYGSGRQTRAFIHIEDMLTCFILASRTPPARGDRVRILNEVSETSSINALADRVAALTGAEIAHVENPREEPESNEFAVDRKKLANMGLKAHTFDDMLGAEVEALTEILSGRRQRTLPSQLKLA